MVPGVMLYNYFSNKEAKEIVKEGKFLYTDPTLTVNAKDQYNFTKCKLYHTVDAGYNLSQLSSVILNCF